MTKEDFKKAQLIIEQIDRFQDLQDKLMKEKNLNTTEREKELASLVYNLADLLRQNWESRLENFKP